MQAILTEEEYREYLDLKASRTVSFEALRAEVVRQVVDVRQGGVDANAILRRVCAIIQDIPNIAQQLRK